MDLLVHIYVIDIFIYHFCVRISDKTNGSRVDIHIYIYISYIIYIFIHIYTYIINIFIYIYISFIYSYIYIHISFLCSKIRQNKMACLHFEADIARNVPANVCFLFCDDFCAHKYHITYTGNTVYQFPFTLDGI